MYERGREGDARSEDLNEEYSRRLCRGRGERHAAKWRRPRCVQRNAEAVLDDAGDDAEDVGDAEGGWGHGGEPFERGAGRRRGQGGGAGVVGQKKTSDLFFSENGMMRTTQRSNNTTSSDSPPKSRTSMHRPQPTANHTPAAPRHPGARSMTSRSHARSLARLRLFCLIQAYIRRGSY